MCKGKLVQFPTEWSSISISIAESSILFCDINPSEWIWNAKLRKEMENLFVQVKHILFNCSICWEEERKMKIMQMLRIEKKDISWQSHMLQVFPLWSYLFRKKVMPDSASSVWARINPARTGAARRTRGKTR